MAISTEELEQNCPRSARKMNRIKGLYWYIKKHGPARKAELVEEFKVSNRTMERDLDVLEHNGLVFSPKLGYWQVTNRKVKGG